MKSRFESFLYVIAGTILLGAAARCQAAVAVAPTIPGQIHVIVEKSRARMEEHHQVWRELGALSVSKQILIEEPVISSVLETVLRRNVDQPLSDKELAILTEGVLAFIDNEFVILDPQYRTLDNIDTIDDQYSAISSLWETEGKDVTVEDWKYRLSNSVSIFFKHRLTPERKAEIERQTSSLEEILFQQLRDQFSPPELPLLAKTLREERENLIAMMNDPFAASMKRPVPDEQLRVAVEQASSDTVKLLNSRKRLKHEGEIDAVSVTGAARTIWILLSNSFSVEPEETFHDKEAFALRWRAYKSKLGTTNSSLKEEMGHSAQIANCQLNREFLSLLLGIGFEISK